MSRVLIILAIVMACITFLVSKLAAEASNPTFRLQKLFDFAPHQAMGTYCSSYRQTTPEGYTYDFVVCEDGHKSSSFYQLQRQ